MATTTVEDLAKELKRTPAALLEQLQAAGINKTSAEDKLTEKDKTKLLEHLQLSVKRLKFVKLTLLVKHAQFKLRFVKSVF